MSITVSDLKRELKPWLLKLVQTGVYPVIGTGTTNKVTYWVSSTQLGAASNLTVGANTFTVQPGTDDVNALIVKNTAGTGTIFNVSTLTDQRVTINSTSTAAFASALIVRGSMPNVPDVRVTDNTFSPTIAIVSNTSQYPATYALYDGSGQGNAEVAGQYESASRGGLALMYRTATEMTTFIYGSGRYGLVLLPVGNIGIGYAATTTSLSYKLDVAGTVGATNYTSTVATGTAPYAATSTTLNTNLNADLLDGKHVGTSGNTVPLLDGTNTWSGAQTFNTTTSTNGRRAAVAIKSGNYTLTATDEVVVFTATATATLPAATGTGQTYRIICRAGILTIDANGSETIKGELTQTLIANEDLIITDTASGLWE